MLRHVLATIEYSAVGNHAVLINKQLEKDSIAHRDYAETIRDDFRDSFKSMTELASDIRTSDTIFYQFANPSPIADLIADSSAELVINYHNVTPARFFDRWSQDTANAVNTARAQLAKLAPLTKHAIAVSEYNRSELVELGYNNIEVIPPVFSPTFFDVDITSNPQGYWLYVGRIAPHKNVHVLLRAFELYKKYYASEAKLKIVGSTDTPLYGKAITELINDRGLNDSVEIVSNIPTTTLIEIYSKASVFVSCSEHEGFCVPLVEAMRSSVPVVAVNAAAVSETTSSAAVLVDSANAYEIAYAAHQAINDRELNALLIKKGLLRAEKYNPHSTAKRYSQYLSKVLS